MEKSNAQETHDFMSVDSFSQLPFIRPAPVKEKPIRLFGFEFGSSGAASSAHSSTANNKHDDAAASSESESAGGLDANVHDDAKDTSNEDSGRKFECHYCCRNFPTSQALGGHQNAHKRERQHAKRAHLQSALAHSSLDHGGGHLYGYNFPSNYRLGSASAFKLPGATPHSPPPYLPSPYSRLYNGHVSIAQPPINGSPLWRIPPVQGSSSHLGFNRDRSSALPLPLFSSGEEGRPSPVGGPSQTRHVYDAATSTVHDHVSLDLHL